MNNDKVCKVRGTNAGETGSAYVHSSVHNISALWCSILLVKGSSETFEQAQRDNTGRAHLKFYEKLLKAMFQKNNIQVRKY